MEMRLEEKDGGAYHHHRSGPRPDGEPKAPIGTKMKFVNQCGYLVRENIPSSTSYGRKKNNDNPVDIVPEKGYYCYGLLAYQSVLPHGQIKINIKMMSIIIIMYLTVFFIN